MPAPERAGAFAMVTRDELWSGGRRWMAREQRLSHGVAFMSDAEIVATDECDEELLAAVDTDLRQASAAVVDLPPADATARVVVSARRVAGSIIRESVITLTVEEHSIVSSPSTLRADAEQLAAIARAQQEVDADPRALPLFWRNGSGAVLLHEAAGHPAEHQQPPVEWPPWLTIRDEPSLVVDDAGRRPAGADLAGGDPPTAIRRASFADVPLRRLSSIVVAQSGAPFTPSRRRIEVLLVAGGQYDPLTGTARVFVSAADVIDGDEVRRARPFMVEASREVIARSIRGATGNPERYPGVVCSSEGQEIVVGSYAPLLVTQF